MSKVLVCGARRYGAAKHERKFIFGTLDAIQEEFGQFILIHGQCGETDGAAIQWARARNAITIAHPSEWAKYKFRADLVKHKEMSLWEPDLAAFFGELDGTAQALKETMSYCARHYCDKLDEYEYETHDLVSECSMPIYAAK